MAHAFCYDPRRADFQDQAYEIYRVLRDEHPLHRDEATGQYVLSRYADVEWATNVPDLLSSEDSMGQGLKQIQQMDPPRHDELRNLVSKVFTPGRMAEMEPTIRRIARRLLDPFSENGRCNLMADYARHLPSLVIGSMIGIPDDRREAFLRWTEQMVAIAPGESQNANVENPAAEIYREFAELLEQRRRERRDDLMSALIDAQIGGQGLSEEELLGFCFVLVVAGNDTTTNLIANGSVLLARHPDQRAELVRDASLIPAAAEEMVRYESPAQALPRTATRDFERHGVRVPAGSTVMLVWGAANHDDREFEDPERFDTKRRIRRHLGYGHGIHFCLGANLARLEARVAFEELLARMPDYKLEAEPRWQTSIWARSYAAVPIAFSPAPRSGAG